jgi:Phytanoyl-CoA dioxygenase (PhyH)
MKNLLRSVLERRAKGQYRERGFYVFRKALLPGEVHALADLARDLISYPGEILRQNGALATNEFFPGTQIVRNPVLNAHLPISEPMKPVYAALRALITSPALAARLRELDGAEHYTIHQTLLFFATQTTSLHLDSWALDTVPRGFAHTLWIPLQDMNFKSGLPCVIPWPQGKVVTEAELGWAGEGSYGERYEHYQQALSEKLFGDSPEVAASLVRMGDLVVWSSLTPHFTLPSQPFPTERLSLQVLLRPAHHRWGNFIDQPVDHPTKRVIRMTDRFSYFISEDICRDYGIPGDPPDRQSSGPLARDAERADRAAPS